MINTLYLSQYIPALMNYDEDILSHSMRTAEYAGIIAEKSTILLREYAYADKVEVLQAIYDAGYLHDFGKIMYSEYLLNSKGKLTPAEKKAMEQHPLRTVEILACIKGFSEQSVVYQTIVKNCCLYHHEKSDGSGYPYGLSKNDIPLEARIISVADVLDALTSERSYKKAWSFEESIEYLNNILIESHEYELKDAFQCVYDELKSVYTTYFSSGNLAIHQTRKLDDQIQANTLTSSDKLSAICFAANEAGMSYGRFSKVVTVEEKEKIYVGFAERLERQRLHENKLSKNQRKKKG